MINKKTMIATVAVFTMLLPVLAFAATVDLPKTGQTTCYDQLGNEIDCAGTGQDGEIQAGISWPSPRFTDNEDGTITDNLTGLMWLQDANCIKTNYPDYDNFMLQGDGAVSWLQALEFVAGINDGTYMQCSVGYTDWRLPNVNELQTLVDLSQSTPALQSAHPFSNVSTAWKYWSSTSSGSGKSALEVSMFAGGFSMLVKPFWDGSVWPVRGVTTGRAKVWKTGQTTCYDQLGNEIDCAGTGQDGEIQAGISWPSPRFTDNEDGTITDNLTGLMWLQDANCIKTNYPGYDNDGTPEDGAVTWQHALDFVKAVNDRVYSKCGISYTDWRLPNYFEMFNLLSPRELYILTWLTGAGFTGVVQYGWYWSSDNFIYISYNSSRTNQAYVININGGQAVSDKTDDRYLFLVRSSKGMSAKAMPWIPLLLLDD